MSEESHSCLLYYGMLHVQIYTIQADLDINLAPHPQFSKPLHSHVTSDIKQFFFPTFPLEFNFNILIHVTKDLNKHNAEEFVW